MKKFIALLLALVMVLSFAACASEDDDDGERRKSRKSKEATEEDMADFLETMEDMYGLDADDFGDAYEIEFSATVSGSEGEDTQEMEMGFVEYKGVWYAAEALLEGF